MVNFILYESYLNLKNYFKNMSEALHPGVQQTEL